jgi:hypothetical protein
MHGFEAIRQGAGNFSIIYKKPFSLKITWNGRITNKDMFDFAGGFYTGIFFLVMNLFANSLFHFIFITIAAVQLYYGLFELMFISKWYYKAWWIFKNKYDLRFLLYVVVIISMFILFYIIL